MGRGFKYLLILAAFFVLFLLIAMEIANRAIDSALPSLFFIPWCLKPPTSLHHYTVYLRLWQQLCLLRWGLTVVNKQERRQWWVCVKAAAGCSAGERKRSWLTCGWFSCRYLCCDSETEMREWMAIFLSIQVRAWPFKQAALTHSARREVPITAAILLSLLSVWWWRLAGKHTISFYQALWSW